MTSATQTAKPPRPGWMERGWRDCSDIKSGDRAGTPRYFRCLRSGCNRLVTHGQVSRGGCFCGNRKLGAATGLTHAEMGLLKIGRFFLDEEERDLIRPLANTGWLREKLYSYLG